MILCSAMPLVMMMLRVPQVVVLSLGLPGRVGGPCVLLGVGC